MIVTKFNLQDLKVHKSEKYQITVKLELHKGSFGVDPHQDEYNLKY